MCFFLFFKDVGCGACLNCSKTLSVLHLSDRGLDGLIGTYPKFPDKNELTLLEKTLLKFVLAKYLLDSRNESTDCIYRVYILVGGWSLFQARLPPFLSRKGMFTRGLVFQLQSVASLAALALPFYLRFPFILLFHIECTDKKLHRTIAVIAI